MFEEQFVLMNRIYKYMLGRAAEWEPPVTKGKVSSKYHDSLHLLMSQYGYGLYLAWDYDCRDLDLNPRCL